MENDIKVLNAVVSKLDAKLEKLKTDLPRFEGLILATGEMLSKYVEFSAVAAQELLQLSAAGKIDPSVASIVNQFITRGHGKLLDKATELRGLAQMKQGELLALTNEKNESLSRISEIEQQIEQEKNEKVEAEAMAAALIASAKEEAYDVQKPIRKTKQKKTVK